MKSRLHLSLCICVFWFSNTNGQISAPGKPYSIYQLSKDKSEQKELHSNTLQIRDINNDDEINRSQALQGNCQSCDNPFYGTGIDVSIDVLTTGKRSVVSEGFVWKATFNSNSALGMQFYFDQYKLPPEASLFIYNEDQSEILGAFTHANNHADGKFATKIIKGKKITIEYFQRHNAQFSGKLHIYKIIHVFRQPNTPLENQGRVGDGAPCNIDVNCADGNPYRSEQKAVCRISYYNAEQNLSGFCSGFLINNKQTPRRPYVITAHHCVAFCDPSSTDYEWCMRQYKSRLSEFVFEFDYERASCGIGNTEPITMSIDGCSGLTWHEQAHFALLDLNVSNIESIYDVNFIGWDRRNLSFASSVGIHHPQGDVKKISSSFSAPTTVYAEHGGTHEDVNRFPKTHWKINWDKGVTEYGSSGSVLLNQGTKLAIGFLTTGKSTCETSGPDYYGRFDYAWDKYDPPFSFSLGNYLDPTNSTQTLLSYIPNPGDAEQDDGNGSGGIGGSDDIWGDPPNNPGVLLKPTYLIGSFDDLADAGVLCSGNYQWKVAQGRPDVWENSFVQLISTEWRDDDFSDPYTFHTGIVRNFSFVKGKEYVLSLEVAHAHYHDQDFHPQSILSVSLGNNIIPRSCVTKGGTAGGQQSILTLTADKYRKSHRDRDNKWYTFAIKFVPNNNYSQILVTFQKHYSITESSVLIDRIGIHEKGDFYNPQVIDVIQRNSSSSIKDLELSNVSITAQSGTSTSPIVEPGRNVIFRSKEIYLKPGFHAVNGSTFTASGDDPIDLPSTSFDAIGPLDFDVVSSMRREQVSARPDEFFTNYSSLNNYYSEETVHVNELQTASIDLTPNPATGSVSVSFFSSDSNFNFHLVLTDLTGRVIFQANNIEKSTTLDLKTFPRGVYIVTCRGQNSIVRERLVID